MHSVEHLMKLADEAIHAYAAWLAEFTTGDLQSLNVERLNTEKDAARERLRAAIAAGVPVLAAGNPSRDQGPCTVCGTPWAKHGTAPTCASHDYTPLGVGEVPRG